MQEKMTGGPELVDARCCSLFTVRSKQSHSVSCSALAPARRSLISKSLVFLPANTYLMALSLVIQCFQVSNCVPPPARRADLPLKIQRNLLPKLNNRAMVRN